MKKTATRLLIIIFLAFIIIFTVYPVLYTILGSFKTNLELQGGGKFFPQNGTFPIMSMLFSLITSSMAAYVIARHNSTGKKSVAGHIFIRYVCSVGSNYAG